MASTTLGGNQMRTSAWNNRSWRDKPVAQAIQYANEALLEDACARLRSFPYLISHHEVDELNTLLEKAATGKAFVIQGGDCAEAFDDVSPEIVESKRSILADQAAFLALEMGCPVVSIGRIAGQYSKPRSVCHEQLSCGSIVNAFRGDNINGTAKTKRSPDPERLILGYHYAAATMSILRMGNERQHRLGKTFFTSHEALNLVLEESMTKDTLNTSAHMLWIGERSRNLDGAHVEYIRGLKNPVGVKLGPTADSTELVKLLPMLDPGRRPGKVSLITRFGAKNVETALPPLIRAVQYAGHQPVWLSDPMHGNTFTAKAGLKTRSMQAILEEITKVHQIHLECGSRLCGLHLEQTGEDVTECTEVNDAEGEFPNYRTLCDPRLSRSQALRILERYIHVVSAMDWKKA